MADISGFHYARAQDISGTVYRIELKFSGMIRVLKLNCKMYIKIPNFQNLKSIKVLPPLGQKPDFQKNTKKWIIQEIFAQLIWNFASQLKICPLIIPENVKSIRAAVPEIAPMRARAQVMM